MKIMVQKIIYDFLTMTPADSLYDYLHISVCLSLFVFSCGLIFSLNSITYISFWYYHHHHVVPPARISLTLCCLSSPSLITSGRPSSLHTVSSQNCSMYIRADRPAFVRPYDGVHRRTSLISSSLLLQQCPACLVRLTWIVFVMRGSWP